jgi:pimeloyl-ACP methyl ester carboxylesterase
MWSRPVRADAIVYRQSGGRKVSLIGQSLGGIYARVLACLVQEQVRCVITLGSPITGSASASNAGPTRR